MSLISNIKKHAKLLFIALIILIALIGYLNYGLHKWFGIGCTPDPFPGEPVVVVDDWTDTLTDAGYKPIHDTKPANIPGDKPPQSATPVLVAEGTVQDSLPVSVVVVETPDNEHWIDIIVGGEHVEIDHVSWADDGAEKDNDWSLIIAGTFDNGLDIGAGLAWEPLQIAGCRIGIETIVDVNRDILTRPDYITLSARVSRRYGAFSLAANAGYAVGEGQGFRCGVDLGIAVGL